MFCGLDCLSIFRRLISLSKSILLDFVMGSATDLLLLTDIDNSVRISSHQFLVGIDFPIYSSRPMIFWSNVALNKAVSSLGLTGLRNYCLTYSYFCFFFSGATTSNDKLRGLYLDIIILSIVRSLAISGVTVIKSRLCTFLYAF